MKSSIMKFSMLAASLLFGASICGAQTTVTVGPTGQYASPCAAFPHLADGDTVQVDANGGIPYYSTSTDCKITNNNLTIVGVNGRPIMDASRIGITKGIWLVNGHDIVIDNFEFRGARIGSENAEAFRIQNSDTSPTPNGGNVTVQHSYIHDDNTGILSEDAPDSNHQWYSATPYITFQYDEFAYCGNYDQGGKTHNMYIGWGGNMDFTLQYSWSHDSYIGHDVKSRAAHNNVLYNLVTDVRGDSSYLLDFPLGGSTYAVGNVLYKAAVTNPNANENMMIWRDQGDSYAGGEGAYGPPNEDFHFINNTVINTSATDSSFNFVNEECFGSSSDSCPPPGGGPALTVPAVIENNIFLGLAGQITNQSEALVENNVTYANTAVTPASLAVLDFADPSASGLDFHILSGSPARGAGIYPPTDNTGTADPKALAAYEYLSVGNAVARPTPTGSTMDAGAYSYPRVGTPPTPSLSYTTSVTAPGSGTITVSGLPTPPAGQYNYVAFISENNAAIPYIPSVATSTGTVTTTFKTVPVFATTVVPIDIYVDGAVLTGSVTVNVGPPTLYSITLDNKYYPQTSVHLSGPSSSPVVVNLSASDPSILYIPATVTVPANQLSAETGSLNGGLNPPAQSSHTVTITGITGSVQKTLTTGIISPDVHAFNCIPSVCPSVVGGQPYTMQFVMAGDSPYGGSYIYITSDTPSVIPNQQFFLPSGASNPPNEQITLTTNTVTTATTVHVTVDYNGHFATRGPITVNPSAASTIAVVSGSGQSAAVGSNFANPLVVLVTSGGNPVSGATVTFAGTGVSFPSGATAVTDSNGNAQVTAQPTTSGALTVSATVPGGSGPANFSETGTAGGALSSITFDGSYGPGSTVHLAAAATSPVVVSLSSSDPTIVHVPSTVTVSTGNSSAETGSMVGSLWGQSPSSKTATLTGIYNGVTKTLTHAWYTPNWHSLSCGSCAVTGGNNINFTFQLNYGGAPYGGATMTFNSSNTAVIPNQSFTLAQGTVNSSENLTTNTVATTTTVNVTATFNGATTGVRAVTVNP